MVDPEKYKPYVLYLHRCLPVLSNIVPEPYWNGPFRRFFVTEGVLRDDNPLKTTCRGKKKKKIKTQNGTSHFDLTSPR